MENKQAQILRAAFATGAIIDALALWPMIFPALGKVLWGIEDASGSYRFAMGYGAALMIGWTGLLVWAYQRPIERRVIAALTMLVIAGFVVTEIICVMDGSMALWRIVPSWILQAVLLGMFGIGYHYPNFHLAEQTGRGKYGKTETGKEVKTEIRKYVNTEKRR